MSEPLFYVDTSDIREGALPELKAAFEDLAGFVEANERDLLAYKVYVSDDGKQVSVVHAHRDAESLDFHMKVAGPQFARFGDLLTLRSITVYGTPSAEALAQLREKVELLGGTVQIQDPHAGFARFDTAP